MTIKPKSNRQRRQLAKKRGWFAEVKYRQHGMTDQILSRRQRQRITKAASLFLAKNPTFTIFDCQFDFIIMQAGQNFGISKVTHIHNTW